MGILVLLLALVPPVLAGLGRISPWWIVVSLLILYARSIVSMNKITGDFRDQNPEQFIRNDKLIKVRIFIGMFIVLFVYFIVRVVTQ
ncbi:hypothetical protein NYQ43_00030 [Xanthomonas translucens pv. translucens]|jgi:hypothetical protein|uniref:hypothetical protein n=1 Tax=Xanthomonas campestris pv. translucens TaxID=343 RepID=UPI001F621F74|nr:hypothetical protein [Xanthomonas translucens]MCT8284116.1 hypothetical protein [Xanthomonas translucens pv. translucens]MCT8301774.1 hypothetical protein [Xanthomonas translucens pv. translucens]UNT98449.1 hypothetical protein KBQ49_15780 [Xanthomonas translucens pv. translucens]